MRGLKWRYFLKETNVLEHEINILDGISKMAKIALTSTIIWYTDYEYVKVTIYLPGDKEILLPLQQVQVQVDSIYRFG